MTGKVAKEGATFAAEKEESVKIFEHLFEGKGRA